jgi:hypothetical protein
MTWMETYLEGSPGQRSHEAAHDHHLVHQEGEQDGGPRKSGGQQQGQEE